MINQDLRQAVESQVTKSEAAIRWIFNKFQQGESVTLAQFASGIRVSKARALETLKNLVSIHIRDQDEGRVIIYSIFIEGTQVPDWLRALLSPTQVYRLVHHRRMFDRPSVLYRDTYLKAMAAHYQGQLAQHSKEAFTEAYERILLALKTVGYEDVEQKDYEFELNPMLNNVNNSGAPWMYGGNRSDIVNLTNCTQLWFSNFRWTFAHQERVMEREGTPQLVYRENRHGPALNLVENQREFATCRVQALVDLLAKDGIHLIASSSTIGQIVKKVPTCIKPSLTFMVEGDMAVSVTVRLNHMGSFDIVK